MAVARQPRPRFVNSYWCRRSIVYRICKEVELSIYRIQRHGIRIIVVLIID
jgi:hypothetical protein